MPWAHNTYDELSKKQKEVLKEIHELKCHFNMATILGEMQVRTEFLRVDFTKRQMNILTFIYNYSFGFGKKWALIPKMKDFEIAGILDNKVKNELLQLEEMNVIEWNREENLFRIREPREWNGLSYNSSFSHDRSRELRRINVIHAGIDISE